MGITFQVVLLQNEITIKREVLGCSYIANQKEKGAGGEKNKKSKQLKKYNNK